MPERSEEIGTPDENTYLFGHSIGSQAILRYLQTIDKQIKIGGCIFVAPWIFLNEEIIREEGEEVVAIAKPWIETPIDWKAIKLHTNNFIVIFSDDDLFVPMEKNKLLFKNKLNAKIIIKKKKGHFDDKAGIKELPILLNELLKLTNELKNKN